MTDSNTPPESREERLVGLLHTGEISAKRYAERIGVSYSTIKRWLVEDMPARRNHNRVWITVAAADAWVDARYPDTISRRGRRNTIYFVERVTDNAVKIGWTGDVMRRVAELRKETGSGIEIIACVPGDQRDEAGLHKRFRDARIAGEWFLPTNELKSYVASLRVRA